MDKHLTLVNDIVCGGILCLLADAGRKEGDLCVNRLRRTKKEFC